MTRLTRYFLPTEKLPPADAEAISHQLMVRAGLVRQVGAGIWSWLPAGLRVHRRAEQIVREELDRIGGQEGSIVARLRQSQTSQRVELTGWIHTSRER